MNSSFFRLITIAGRGAAIAFLTLATQTANAGITYVDASTSNTVGAASDLVDWNSGSEPATDGTAANDGLWRFRSAIGNGGIWEATGTTAAREDAVEIITSATGLTDGLYDAYVFYYAVSATGDYPIRAGFSSNPNANAVFDQYGDLGTTGGTAGGDALADLMFDVAPPTGTETRTLLYGLIGQTTVSGGTLDVYIDDWPAISESASQSNFRTWYAGIGYARVPEPSSVVLVLLGAAFGVVGARYSRRG